MIDLQNMLDTIGEMARKDRSRYHINLGGLIAALEKADPTATVITDDERSMDGFCSYRGYYSDLAIEPSEAPCTVADLLREAKDANGRTFEGYKGGDFRMDDTTPIWFGSYGCCGPAVMGIDTREDGTVVLVLKDVD